MRVVLSTLQGDDQVKGPSLQDVLPFYRPGAPVTRDKSVLVGVVVDVPLDLILPHESLVLSLCGVEVFSMTTALLFTFPRLGIAAMECALIRVLATLR
eukprot:Em0007g129a